MLMKKIKKTILKPAKYTKRVRSNNKKGTTTLKISRIENITRKALKYYFPNEEVIYNYRPDFLKNIKTGRNFELDIFYPKLKLAVEVNGIAHTLTNIKERDEFKKKQCKKENIVLLRIKYHHKLLGLRKFLRSIFPNKQFPKYDCKLAKEIRRYKPSKTAFNNLARRVKHAKNNENIENIQRKETEFNRRKIAYRASLKLKNNKRY